MSKFQGTITTRLETIFSDLKNEFGTVCTQYDIDVKLKELNRARGKSDYYSKLSYFMDLLDSLGVQYDDTRDDFDYYEKIAQNLKLPDFEDLEGNIVHKLYQIFEDYPKPDEYMLRIVNNLSNPEDNWNDDTLRLRILKQFIKYGNSLYDAGAGGKSYVKKYIKNNLDGEKFPSKGNNEVQFIIDRLSDDIFEVLKGANKDQKEFSGTYGLLKICDDLASGQFRMNGATKKNLYLFAMCFQMTFFVDSSDEANIIDYESSIEKNLFRDYYMNNLMRFLTKEYRENRSSFEKEPNGIGINYKNFAEMVYLYYIAKPYDAVNPEEKIKLATEMIKRIKEKCLGKAPVIHRNDATTQTIKSIFCEDILMKNEEDFEQFIIENYDCNTIVSLGEGKGETRVSEMQLAYEQNTAHEYFDKAVNELTKETDIDDLTSGLWFVDSTENFEKYSDKYDDIDKEKFNDLMCLISEVDGLTDLPARIEGVNNSKEMTRTALLAAYYQLFMLQHEDNENIETFGEIFEGFSMYVNDRLRDCSYQIINPKNIFDILIVFSIYSYQII